MYRNRSLLSVVTAALLAFPAARSGAQDKPVTPKTVGTSVERESKRAANRTGDVVQKAGKQTEAQAKRAAKSVKKVYSRKERRAERGAEECRQHVAPREHQNTSACSPA